MKTLAALSGFALFLVPTAAWAHPGHQGLGGLVPGIWHPLTGTDHLVAMVLVGVWASLLAPQKRAALLIPLAFLVAMVAGFISIAVLGGGLAEPLILVSLVVLGLVAALQIRPRVELAVVVAALFGFAHGMAHGFEPPDGALTALFVLGYLASTAALHGAGLLLASLLPLPLVRTLSAASAATALAVAVTA